MKNKIELLKHIKNIGIPFEQFYEKTVLNSDKLVEDEHEKELHEYRILNKKRTARILKSYKKSDEIKNAVSKITEKQTWLIITEDWCGDSAQNIPYISKMIEANSNIEFKIIYRDENPDIIDQYLTNGGRAIPKIVGFSNEGNEIFQWGPRPDAAKQLVSEWKESGFTQEEFHEKLHLWYGRDRGKTLEKEFIELLNNVK